MDKESNRRTEPRLRYHWPVWFGDSCGHSVSQGQMVDVNSVAAAFTCDTHACCPHPNQKITTRFNIPKQGFDNEFELSSITRTGNVYRIDQLNDHKNRVVVQFMQPLDFKPGEKQVSEDQCFAGAAC
jgi:hypothetical protein